jgi:RecA-family ATPase
MTMLSQPHGATRESSRIGEADTRETSNHRFSMIKSADLEQRCAKREWLVENVLIRGQPGVIGGPPKSLKTSIAIDLAISLGTASPFLGTFNVPHIRNVAVFSGESGDSTILDIASRVCRQKNVKLDRHCRVQWQFDLPRLADYSDLQSLGATLKAEKIRVVIVDPLYLCLTGGSKSISATNLYDVGPVLRQFAMMCQGVGATAILVHHTTKTSGKQSDKAQPPELGDLAFAGITEFARQWILVKHREDYQPGTGTHKLVVGVGGSAGHSSSWNVDISEGSQRSDFSGRNWDVSARSFEERPSKLLLPVSKPQRRLTTGG